jgi:hypothetical protein
MMLPGPAYAKAPAGKRLEWEKIRRNKKGWSEGRGKGKNELSIRYKLLY